MILRHWSRTPEQLLCLSCLAHRASLSVIDLISNLATFSFVTTALVNFLAIELLSSAEFPHLRSVKSRHMRLAASGSEKAARPEHASSGLTPTTSLDSHVPKPLKLGNHGETELYSQRTSYYTNCTTIGQ